jgi:DNA repair exonuclease SbcCD ATPase subunit
VLLLQLLELLTQGLAASAQALRREAEAAADEVRSRTTAAQQAVQQLQQHLQKQHHDLDQALQGWQTSQSDQLNGARQELERIRTQLQTETVAQGEAIRTATSQLKALEQSIQALNGSSEQQRQRLEQTLESLQAGQRTVDQQLETSTRQLSRLDQQLQSDLEGLRQTLETSRLSEQLNQERGGFESSVPLTGTGTAHPSDGSYRDACAELGVVPGCSWEVVRATWRRNLKQWHPDQGGDAKRWLRRQAAYELLTAWYAFGGG